jgi:hypothetical protein
MGTWDEGILDNDTSLDGLGDLQHEVVEDIVAFGSAKPTTSSTNKLCAAVGVLLQLSPYAFKLDTDSGPKIVAAIANHAKGIEKLSPAARKVMNLVADGKGEALADRPEKMSAKHIALLHTGGKECPFGKREASLFESKEAAAYVQSVAKRCIEAVDEDFEDESNWSDLCREGMGMGHLAVLMVLEPCKVPATKIARWRKLAQKGLAELEADPNDELEFHRKYYKTLDGVFGVLAKRFG